MTTPTTPPKKTTPAAQPRPWEKIENLPLTDREKLCVHGDAVAMLTVVLNRFPDMDRDEATHLLQAMMRSVAPLPSWMADHPKARPDLQRLADSLAVVTETAVRMAPMLPGHGRKKVKVATAGDLRSLLTNGPGDGS